MCCCVAVKERLNPSRGNSLGKHRRRKADEDLLV